MNHPKISVIIPVYNAEKTLKSTLLCTLRAGKNIEIILVDDGSTDQSPAICDEFAKTHENAICIHKENGGVSSARNRGLDVAMGDWIGFLDADDTVEPHTYDRLIDEATKFDAEIAQCAIFLNYEDRTEIVFSPRRAIKTNVKKHNFPKVFAKYISYGSCCKIFKRSAIGETRFDEETAIGEDLRFNLDVLSKSKDILLCPEPMYHYLQHGGSATHTVISESRLTVFHRMLKKAEADFKGVRTLSKIISDTNFLNVADIASKIVTNNLDCDELFDELRTEVKGRAVRLIFAGRISLKQRIKLLLLAYFPRLYKSTLLKSKQTKVAS